MAPSSDGLSLSPTNVSAWETARGLTVLVDADQEEGSDWPVDPGNEREIVGGEGATIDDGSDRKPTDTELWDAVSRPRPLTQPQEQALRDARRWHHAKPLALDASEAGSHAPSMSERHSGGCLCGAIRFTTAGAPTSTNICYCTQCQRQTGAPMPAFVTYRTEQLTLSAGEPASYRSSERAERQFCARCGSSLFWVEVGSAEVDVLLGTFDEPSRLPPPQHAIWAAHRVSWLPELESIPSYDGRRAP